MGGYKYTQITKKEVKLGWGLAKKVNITHSQRWQSEILSPLARSHDPQKGDRKWGANTA